MLDVTKLATLRAVIERGSFSAAADALMLTQPAVSRQITLLERQAGTQLLRRTRQGVRPTEAGRILAEHAATILGQLARAEAHIGDLAGLRSGRVRLGSFLTALIYLSAELAVLLEARHPELYQQGHSVIEDVLVDRRTALRQLQAGELDLAIVFEHAFEPEEPDPDVEIVPLFPDPPRILLPSRHRLAGAASVRLGDLAGETWIRAHHGSAARLVDHVLRSAQLQPELLLAGHGDEPVEAQAFVAAGRGVTIAHDLNVLIRPEQVVAVPLTGGGPVRHIQAAIMRDQRAPAPRAVLEVLRQVGHRHARRR
ncbi:LysR family transcriptional regulator [Jiangella aurantiaca]|uniref:LysR family transcriptional regulator n=1 Tax=Jiangella aurantiaca TaxID=2530373 RepID=A0A4R5A9C4_9ACTN|nr:LysR family transcriptional regulator [Jiangella aurantiaca]TDD68908.1 LysR family transcriptional regulator [Jiangella aurantiaca]